jgi:hypothetical protein
MNCNKIVIFYCPAYCNFAGSIIFLLQHNEADKKGLNARPGNASAVNRTFGGLVLTGIVTDAFTYSAQFTAPSA